MLDYLEDLAHIGALTFGRAGAKFFFLEAVGGTLVRAGLALLEYRPLIEILETSDVDGEGRATDMVEEEKTGRQLFEMHLVAYKGDLRVGEEIFACSPSPPARRAFFEDVFVAA